MPVLILLASAALARLAGAVSCSSLSSTSCTTCMSNRDQPDRCYWCFNSDTGTGRCKPGPNVDNFGCGSNSHIYAPPGDPDQCPLPSSTPSITPSPPVTRTPTPSISLTQTPSPTAASAASPRAYPYSCPAGYYNQDRGTTAASCRACAAGTISDGGLSFCFPCPTGSTTTSSPYTSCASGQGAAQARYSGYLLCATPSAAQTVETFSGTDCKVSALWAPASFRLTSCTSTLVTIATFSDSACRTQASQVQLSTTGSTEYSAVDSGVFLSLPLQYDGNCTSNTFLRVRQDTCCSRALCADAAFCSDRTGTCETVFRAPTDSYFWTGGNTAGVAVGGLLLLGGLALGVVFCASRRGG